MSRSGVGSTEQPRSGGAGFAGAGAGTTDVSYVIATDRFETVREVVRAVAAQTIRDRIETYDVARQMEGATEVKCSEFGDAIIERM